MFYRVEKIEVRTLVYLSLTIENEELKQIITEEEKLTKIKLEYAL